MSVVLSKPVRMPLDRMGIGVADPERDEFVLYAYEAENEPANWMPGARFPLEGTVPGWVIRKRRAYIARDLEGGIRPGSDAGPTPLR